MNTEEYAALVARLREKNGDQAATLMLDALESVPDPAARLQALKETLRSQGVSVYWTAAPPAPAPLTVAETLAGVGAEPSTARARKNWKRGAVRAPWRKKTRGEPDRTIYPKGGFNLVIRVIDGEIRAAMSKTVLLAYLVGCEEADICGQFELPAGELGERIGCNRRNAQKALTTLLTAGVFRVIHPGGPKTPNVYSLVPAEKFDRAHALEVFRQARQSAAADILRARKVASSQPA
jgi:hypothetical protein